MGTQLKDPRSEVDRMWEQVALEECQMEVTLEHKQKEQTMDIARIGKTADGKHYVAYHLGKEVSRKSTLARVAKALAAYIKGRE